MDQTRTAGNATGATATTGAAAAGGAPAPAAALPANCTKVQLQFWTPFTGPDGPFMQALVDKFNSAQQKVKVNHTIQSEYNTQLGTAAASGTLPDVAVINEDQVATQAFRNVLRPMDAAVKAGGIDASDFPKVAWQAGQVAGKTYGVPLSFVAMTMYVNQDLLSKAGISAPPKNDAEFQKAAQAMTQGNSKGFMLTTGFPVQQIFQMLLHQYGGTEFSQDFSKATWNSDAGVKALTWMKDAQTKYSDPNLEVDAELNAFKAGNAGMIWNGIWQIPNVTGKGVEFKSQAAPVPQIGPNPAVWAGGPLLTLPTQKSAVDPCKDAAAGVFVRYLLDNSVEWAKAGNIPASNRARNSAEFKALPHAVIGASVENPVFPPPVPGIGDAFTPLNEAVSAVMSGSATDIKAALDDAANRSNQVLAENKKNYGTAPKGQ
jgi:multiple sugar transport system substrate-binding protein